MSEAECTTSCDSAVTGTDAAVVACPCEPAIRAKQEGRADRGDPCGVRESRSLLVVSQPLIASTNVRLGLWQPGQRLDHTAPLARRAATSAAVSALALESSLARNLG